MIFGLNKNAYARYIFWYIYLLSIKAYMIFMLIKHIQMKSPTFANYDILSTPAHIHST